jgi:hypothetical protein
MSKGDSKEDVLDTLGAHVLKATAEVEAIEALRASVEGQAEEVASAITSARQSLDSDTKAASESRKEAKRDSAHIASARATADAAIAALEKAQQGVVVAQQRVAEGAAAIAAAKTTADATLATIQAASAETAADAAEAARESSNAETHARAAKDALAELQIVKAALDGAHTAAAEREKKLEEMNTKFNETLKKVESLLPGATSAGLASAFREQKLRFSRPMRLWIITLGTALFLIFCAGLIGFDASLDSWDLILRHLVQRLPLVGPLVWVAIYAGRNFMHSQRLHEEYAYKEAISTAFEGYKREFSEVDFAGSADYPPPLVVLCNNVLQTLAQRPGRIYEEAQEDITPFAPLAKVVAPFVEGIPKALEASLPKIVGK